MTNIIFGNPEPNWSFDVWFNCVVFDKNYQNQYVSLIGELSSLANKKILWKKNSRRKVVCIVRSSYALYPLACWQLLKFVLELKVLLFWVWETGSYTIKFFWDWGFSMFKWFSTQDFLICIIVSSIFPLSWELPACVSSCAYCIKYTHVDTELLMKWHTINFGKFVMINNKRLTIPSIRMTVRYKIIILVVKLFSFWLLTWNSFTASINVAKFIPFYFAGCVIH